MQFTRGASALAATALLVTGLSACGDDSDEPPITLSSSSSDDSTTSSSTTSTSSSTASSSTTSSNVDLPDDIPAAARENTKAGAAAFGEYYYLTFGEADHTGNTTDLASLGLTSCEPCQQAIMAIDADAKKGQTRSANPYTLTNVEASKREDKGFKVTMHVDVKAHHVYKNDKIISDVEPDSFTLTEHVVWTDGRWQVADWVIS